MKTLSILGRLGTEISPSPPARPAYETLPALLAGQAPLLDALYLHVPFCASKCHYCDFYSLAGHLDRADAYLDALEREMRWHVQFFGKPAPLTIFIGGGTPTLLPPPQLARLLRLLHEYVDFSHISEFTIEANPNTFDAEKAAIAKAGGINRISFGAQSFNPPELTTLQRDHDPQTVPIAFAIAREAGIANLNVDLIFGIPGQTLASWDFSLQQALALNPSHISCYSLTYEPNTAMTARLGRGEFSKIDEDTELAMFEHVYSRLRNAGFARYETSNYARLLAPDAYTESAQVCLHNLIYWNAGNWLGWGPSAGSHIALPHHAPTTDRDAPVAWQWKNAGSLAHYLGAFSCSAPHLPITQFESLTRSHWAAAAAVFWLRLTDGLPFHTFRARTGVDVEPTLRSLLAPFAEQGFAALTPDSARITEKGVAVSNHILALRVLPAIEALT